MITIIQPCTVKLDGVIQHLSPGARLHLPTDKEQRLIAAGYAEAATPNIEDFSRLVAELTASDPKCGCWDWIIQNHPETWRRFIQAMLANDIYTTRSTFDEMTAAWAAAKPTCERNQP